MNIKQISLAILFQIAFLPFAFGQTIDLNSKLSKKKMYKDFDQFVQIIDSSTQTLVRKIATGYDAAEEIRQRRPQIEKIKSYGEFIHFLNNCLPLTMAVHARMAEDYQWRSGKKYIDTQIVIPLYQAYNEYTDNHIHGFGGMGLGNGFYYKGKYYAMGKHVYINLHTLDTVSLSNFCVLKHNDEIVGALKNNQITDRPSSYRWDYKLQQYYSVYGASFISRSDKITAEDYLNKKIVELNMKDWRRGIFPSLSDDILASLPKGYVKSDNMKVTYYDSLHLLFIYMGAMIEDHAFVDSIKSIGVGKQIDKVILDVRGNSGGSDAAWENVLKAIIKKPLPIRETIGVRNTEVMRRILEDWTEGDNAISKQTIPFLDSVEFLIYTYEGLSENGDTISYVPDTNSLQYDGIGRILRTSLSRIIPIKVRRAFRYGRWLVVCC